MAFICASVGFLPAWILWIPRLAVVTSLELIIFKAVGIKFSLDNLSTVNPSDNFLPFRAALKMSSVPSAFSKTALKK